MASLAALVSLGAMATAVIAGLVVHFAFGDNSVGRLAGGGLVALAGAAAIAASKSYAFARVFHRFADRTRSLSPQPGRYPAPMVVGFVFLVLGILLAVIGH